MYSIVLLSKPLTTNEQSHPIKHRHGFPQSCANYFLSQHQLNISPNNLTMAVTSEVPISAMIPTFRF